MRFTFITRKGSSETVSILLVYRHKDGRANFTTGARCQARDWNPPTPRRPLGRVSTQAEGATLANELLRSAARRLTSILEALTAEGIEPTAETVSERWKASKQPAKAGGGVVEDYAAWIESADHLTEGTRVVHRTVVKHLTAYMKGRALTYEALTVDWFRRFSGWLTTANVLFPTRYADSTRTIESRWKVVRFFRMYLRAAEIEQRHTNGAYRYFTRSSMTAKAVQPTPLPALTSEELQAIVGVDLSDSPALGKARDLFVAACLSGLRFSDLHRLTHDAITTDSEGRQALRFSVTKTGRAVYIPLTEALRAVLSRWEFRLPSLHNAIVNRSMKIVAERAGLDRPVTITRTVGRGEERTATVPLHRLVVMHSARRTFVSLSLQRGVSVESVMVVTGLSRRQVDGYLRLSETQADEAIRAAWQ